MRIAVEINSIEELTELADFGRKFLATDETESFEPEDSDEEILGDDYDNAGRARLVGTEDQWARIRALAGVDGERDHERGVGAPRKSREYFISPEKVADIDVYIRIANELGEFGPKFFRDKWQEIKAMYQTYKDEGVPGRKRNVTATPPLDVPVLKGIVTSVENLVAEAANVSRLEDEKPF